MAETKFRKVRLFKVSRELNIAVESLVEHLESTGHAAALAGSGINAAITDEEAYLGLLEEFAEDKEIAARIRRKRAARVEEEEAAAEAVATEVEAAPAEAEAAPTEAPAAEPTSESTADSASEPAPDAVAEAAPEEAAEDAADAAVDVAAPESATDDAPAQAQTEAAADASTGVSDDGDAGEQEVAVGADPVASDVMATEAEASPSETTSDSDKETPAAPAEAIDEATVDSTTEAAPVSESETAEAAGKKAADAPDAVAEAAKAADESTVDVTAKADSEAPATDEQAESAPPTAADESVSTPSDEQVAEPAESGAAATADATAEPAADAEADTTAEATADGTDTTAAAAGDGSIVDPESLIKADRHKLAGTKILGKIDLVSVRKAEAAGDRKKKRKRIEKGGPPPKKPTTGGSAGADKAAAKKKKAPKKRGPVVDAADVEKTLQETLRELEQGASRARQRRRRQRRDDRAAERDAETARKREEEGVLRVTEYVSTGELANLMDVGVNEVIGKLFSSGMMVSINQRLDADTITIVADEFGFQVEFIQDIAEEDIILEDDAPEDLRSRAPVVTVMGHVDHGKTSLLDYIRKANVVAGEAGGITQHIGAYRVQLESGKEVTFLDTPGHEAFTAMRARGAQVTDIVILVVAADDSVMPQTIEAINHAKAADVPIVVAINKVDKADVNIPRVQQQLSEHGVLVEQYGGKAQCALVSAMTGAGIDDLMEKVVLESDLLDLKANPNRNAVSVVIESRLDKGRGTVATVLVQNGTMRVGDVFIAGMHSGRIRAMYDERDRRIEEVGPSSPALVTGLDGSPEVGDAFIVVDEEREAREIAQKRQKIMREQSMRQRKHITLDEIGRRLALGDFQELNLIVKADVGGSVEAVADSLLKLSTEEVAVNIVHKGVGAINDGDIMLASASDAIIIGFQVRPAPSARLLAEQEQIDIRLYSVIYHAIEEIHDALEGLLSPDKSEKILGVAEVRETFKVPKIGMIAGCYVTEGKIRRSDRVHLIRDGVVIYEGALASLKRFKDDAREVANGYECGMGIENFNDIKVGDQIESYEIVETARKLEV